METGKHINWDTVHTVAKRVVNNTRKRYLLSNEEAEDATSSLLIKLVAKAPEYTEGAAAIGSWLTDIAALYLPDIIEELRGGGMTGVRKADGSLRVLHLHDFNGPVPASDDKPGDILDEMSDPIRPGAVYFEDLIYAPESTPDAADAMAQLAQAMACLSEKDRQLLTDCYGLEGAKPKTHAELAREHGVSRQAISERVERAINKARLKNVLAKLGKAA